MQNVLTFAPGTTEVTVPVQTSLDTMAEGMEQFEGRLSVPSTGANIGAATATVDISGDYILP